MAAEVECFSTAFVQSSIFSSFVSLFKTLKKEAFFSAWCLYEIIIFAALVTKTNQLNILNNIYLNQLI